MLSHIVVAIVHLIIPIVGINHGLFICSSMGGHLGCFQFLAVMNIVAVNILVGSLLDDVGIRVGYIRRRGI